MKNSTKKILIGLIAVICMATTAFAFLSYDNSVPAEALEYEATLSENLEQRYDLGQTLTIPSATINVDGQNVGATKSVIIFPDGKTYSQPQVTFVKSGEYTIVYYAIVNGTTVCSKKNFRVNPEEDIVSPRIEIYGKFAEDIFAKVALREEVTIPYAVATDDNLIGGVNVYVYTNYGSEHQSSVGIKDNKFTPATIGEYTLIYSAEDSFGNKTTERRVILVSETQGDSAVRFTVGEQEKAVSGKVVNIPEVKIDGLYDDESAIKAYACFNDEKEEVKDNKFFAKHTGKYQIIYEYVTALKTYTVSKEFNVVSENVTLFENNAMPKYFIKGAKYSFDSVYATTYSGENPVYSKAEAYVSQDGGEYVKMDYDSVLITASNKVRFKFVAGSSNKETDEFDVVDVGFGKEDAVLEEYFTTSAEKSAVYEGMQFTVKTPSVKTDIEFINVISLSTFNLEFVVPAGYGKIDAISIRLTDFYDIEKSVCIEYRNDGGTAMFTVNDERVKSLRKNFVDITHNVYYDESQEAFYDGATSNSFKWESNFNSDKVFLEVSVVEAEADSRFVIRKIGEQKFSEGSSDQSKPIIYIKELKQGAWAIDEEVLFDRAQIVDVMTPYLKGNAKFTVKMPDGSYAVATDGTTLNEQCDTDKDYRVKLTQYGNYNVIYSYTDQNGRSDSIGYTIRVYDRRPPTITLTDVAPEEAIRVKLGETVKVSGYSVSDGQTETAELKSYVALYNPSGVYVSGEKSEFIAESKGVYRIVYYCIDSDNNYTSVYYTVVVE